MTKNLTLKILSSQSQTEKKDVKSILAPGLSGDFEVRPEHANMIFALRPGVVHLKPSEEKIDITQGDLLSIRQNHCVLSVFNSSESSENDDNKGDKEIKKILDASFLS